MNVDVLIVGAGLAGASLAVALRASRLSVAVVEGKAPLEPEGLDQRVYAISPVSQRFLDTLGVWEHARRERICAVTEMEIHGDAGGELRFSAYGSGLTELAWIAESWVLHRELWESMKRQHNVRLMCPARCVDLAVTGEGATVVLEDGTRVTARLLVGADGADSWVRPRAGIQVRTSAYNELGVVANFDCGSSHGGVARQWFTREGVVALLPLPGRRVSLVWSAPDEVASALLSLDDQAFCDRVGAATAGRAGDLALITPRAAFPLRLMRVDDKVRARVALIGDAAHAIHPLSGHGINLGFLDAKELAERLVDLKPWEDPGSLTVLRGYARARAEEPLLMQAVTHGLNRLFATDNGLVRSVRNQGMKLTGGVPVIRDALVRYATVGHF